MSRISFSSLKINRLTIFVCTFNKFKISVVVFIVGLTRIKTSHSQTIQMIISHSQIYRRKQLMKKREAFEKVQY